jgi:hypothetical protein
MPVFHRVLELINITNFSNFVPGKNSGIFNNFFILGVAKV